MLDINFYHVLVQREEHTISKPRWKWEINLTKEQVLNDFFVPFHQDELIICNGSVFKKEEITSIDVYQTNNEIKRFDDKYELDKEIRKGKQVTRIFYSESRNKLIKNISTNNKQVFIVHGHDTNAKLELARLLEKEFKLDTIILHEQPNRGNTIIEKLERYSQYPGFVFVLLTPDDVGDEKQEDSKKIELKPRARQNVILELGYFLGKVGRKRVCCLFKENVEIPSDINGVLYVAFKEEIKECYYDIKKELESVKMI